MRFDFRVWLSALACILALQEAEPEGRFGEYGREGCPSSALLQSKATLSNTHTHAHGQTLGLSSGLTGPEVDRWLEAAQEEGLSFKSVSEFGRSVPKFSRSAVSKLLSIRHTTRKHHTYNFVGRLRGCNLTKFAYGFDEIARRAWIVPFVLHNFSHHDLLNFNDGSDFFEHPLGAFDRSFDSPLLGQAPQQVLYDYSYYTTLAASNFTLCPGGDTAWSMRSYEVALMGSICVIRDPKEDWDPSTSLGYTGIAKVHMVRLINMYRYLRSDEPPIYHQDWVDDNLRLFIKYQTFIQGDNVPPAAGGSD